MKSIYTSVNDEEDLNGTEFEDENGSDLHEETNMTILELEKILAEHAPKTKKNKYSTAKVYTLCAAFFAVGIGLGIIFGSSMNRC